MIRVFERTEIGQEFFSSRPQYAIFETGISGSNRFVRASSPRGGSNAPHPALSVPHLDANAYGGSGKQQATSGQQFCSFWAVLSIVFLDLDVVWRA